MVQTWEGERIVAAVATGSGQVEEGNAAGRWMEAEENVLDRWSAEARSAACLV